MVTIGIDPHKQTHCGVAVDALGSELDQRTVPARRTGFGQLLDWGRRLDSERVWVIEDVRNVSGSLERFFLDRGETVVRLPPRLMSDLRRGARERGRGRMKLGEKIIDVRPLDAIRVPPQTARAFEAGPDGLEFIAVGSHHPGDGEPVEDPWVE